MTPHATNLTELLESVGATEVKTGKRAGLNYVCFKDRSGFRHTRFGISDYDLEQRIKCYAKRVKVL